MEFTQVLFVILHNKFLNRSDLITYLNISIGTNQTWNHLKYKDEGLESSQ